MTIAVDLGRKATKQTNKIIKQGDPASDVIICFGTKFNLLSVDFIGPLRIELKFLLKFLRIDRCARTFRGDRGKMIHGAK